MTEPEDHLSAKIGLKTRHVFLDTQVYRMYGHNLNTRVLQSFLKQITNHICTLHITDITKMELYRQIDELAVEAAQVINKGNKELRRWQSRSIWQKEPAKPADEANAGEMAISAIRDFNVAMGMSWNVVEHLALEMVPPIEIFESYFRRLPPFDKADSKEFPDAFVVAALDKWCTAKHQRMYVITRDGAMQRAAKRTNTLIPLPSLDMLLQLIAKAQDPKILERVERILNSTSWDVIEEQIRESIDQLGTVYTGSLQDGEVVEHSSGNDAIKLVEFHVVSVAEDQIEVVAKARVPISFDVQYLDTSTASYDSEDKEYIGGESEIESFDVEKGINVFVVIDPQDDQITDVDILTRDLFLEEPYDNFK
jgi:hypothetical protein